MNPPKSKTTMRISTDMGFASQYANSPMTVIELKGKTPQEKGEHYLKLSLGALQELADLLGDARLSESEKAAYHDAYNSGKARYDGVVQLRDQLLTQRKSFGSFILNLFVRKSPASRFHKISYRNYSAIQRTSEEIKRRLLPDRDATLTSGSLENSDVSICEENPPDVVEGNVLVKDLPPNETLRGISLDIHSEQEENEAFAIFSRLGTLARATSDDSDDDDDSATIKPSTTQSTPPSPNLSCTVVYNFNNISSSLLSFNSEVTGAAITVAHQ